MILSSDELEILAYLKSWNGASISMLEICRCAGGRRKFKETPNWAKGLMGRLVEAKMIQVNDRGHYRFPAEAKPAAHAKSRRVTRAHTIGDNYFPATDGPRIVGDNYFPSPVEPAPGTE